MKRIRWRALASATIALMSAASFVSPTVGQTQQQMNLRCVNKDIAPDLRISGCTAAIQSGKWSGQGLTWAYHNRGNAYRAKRDTDRAIADYDEAIRLDPKYSSAFNGRGNAYQDKKDYDRAIADYDQAIRLDPNNSSAFNDRGNAYRAKGETNRAIADHDQAIRLDKVKRDLQAPRAVEEVVQWQIELVGHIERFKRYPEESRSRGERGMARVAFTIDREGRLLSSHIVQSSGSSTLDNESLAMLMRADPMPRPPDRTAARDLSFVLPVRFAH